MRDKFLFELIITPEEDGGGWRVEGVDARYAFVGDGDNPAEAFSSLAELFDVEEMNKNLMMTPQIHGLYNLETERVVGEGDLRCIKFVADHLLDRKAPWWDEEELTKADLKKALNRLEQSLEG